MHNIPWLNTSPILLFIPFPLSPKPSIFPSPPLTFVTVCACVCMSHCIYSGLSEHRSMVICLSGGNTAVSRPLKNVTPFSLFLEEGQSFMNPSAIHSGMLTSPVLCWWPLLLWGHGWGSHVISRRWSFTASFPPPALLSFCLLFLDVPQDFLLLLPSHMNLNFLSLLTEFWDDKCEPPLLVYVVLGIKLFLIC